MAGTNLAEFVERTATNFGIPGVAAGVLLDSMESYACHGVTSTENPLPVDEDTLFLLASVSKTYTATALMRLVAEGHIELNAPVRRYVREFKLKDERIADEVTVLNLLNHTSGMSWGLSVDTGEGDDALAGYVSKLPELDLIAPPGQRTSYSQAGYNLAGRIIEKVASLTFERAVASLVFAPLGLSHSFYARDDVMTRRFVVGHNRAADGRLSIARLWRPARGNNPGGGIAASVSDQLRWARFHLGDGRSESAERVLPAKVLHQMKEPTTALRGSNMGDAVGISWFLRNVNGVGTIGHGGSANGQFTELLIVPERQFAVVSLCNAGPDGIPCNQAIVRWALQTYLGLIDRDPEPMPFDKPPAEEVVGSYEDKVQNITIDIKDGSGLRIACRIKPEIRAAAKKELPPDHEPCDFGLLPGDKDEYIITSSALKGLRGFFSRDENGAVVGVDIGGRQYSRVQSIARPIT